MHGVPICGYHWRHIFDRVHTRRCIAIDLMGLGYTEIAPGQDVSFTAQAQMLAEVLDVIGIDKVDLVGNDSAAAPLRRSLPRIIRNRLRSLVLTNCDVHDGWPPPQVLPLMEHCRKGTIAQVFQPTLERPDLARERYARGESVPLFRSYFDTSIFTDDLIRLYLQPLLSSPQRIDALRALLARLRQQAHRRDPFARCRARGADADRVGTEGHLLRQEMGLLAEGHHPRRQGRHRGRGRAAVLPRRPPDTLARPMLKFWEQWSRP